MSPNGKVSPPREAAGEAQPSSRVLTLTLPLPMNIANSRMHWRVKEALRQSYFAACDYLLTIKQVPPPPHHTKPLERCALRATLKVGGAMDDDNAVARCKWSIDWLKTRGYIRDDSRKHLRWAQFPEQTIKRDGDYLVTLTLTELP